MSEKYEKNSSEIRLKTVPKRTSGYNESIFDIMDDVSPETESDGKDKKVYKSMVEYMEDEYNSPTVTDNTGIKTHKLSSLDEKKLDKDYIISMLNKPINIDMSVLNKPINIDKKTGKITLGEAEADKDIDEIMQTPVRRYTHDYERIYKDEYEEQQKRDASSPKPPPKPTFLQQNRRTIVFCVYAAVILLVVYFVLLFIAKGMNDGVYKDVVAKFPVSSQTVKNNAGIADLFNENGEFNKTAYYNNIVFAQSIDSEEKSNEIANSGYAAYDNITVAKVPFDSTLLNMDLGAAIFSSLYHSDNLPISASSYTTVNGKTIDGYDLSDVSFFANRENSLGLLKFSSLNDYAAYLSRLNKWKYADITGGVLPFSKDTLNFAQKSHLSVVESGYKFEPEPHWTDVIRTLTNQELQGFSRFENAYIDVNTIASWEKKVVGAVKYYDNILNSPKGSVLSFGKDGEYALSQVKSSLGNGQTAVLLVDGLPYNAYTLSETADGVYTIELFDTNEKPVRHILKLKNIQYNQYYAELDGGEVPVFVVIL